MIECDIPRFGAFQAAVVLDKFYDIRAARIKKDQSDEVSQLPFVDSAASVLVHSDPIRHSERIWEDV